MGDVDVVVIGAGFAGLYALHKLREAGFTARVFERGEAVGGTWFWNRYPGARVDIQSVEYMFTKFPDLEQEWNWTELMPAQEEIERYLNWVADKLELRDGIVRIERDRANGLGSIGRHGRRLYPLFRHPHAAEEAPQRRRAVRRVGR